MEDRKKRLAAYAANVDRTTNNTEEEDHRRSGSDAMTPTTTTDHVTDVMDHNDDYRTTTTNDSTTIPNKRKLLHFRNYIPSDPTFIHDNDDHPPTNDIHPPISTTKSVLQLALERARSELLLHSNTTTTTLELKHYYPTTTKPKNHTIHADLQRNIQSKLHRLEQRTQRALVSILRQRLEQEATTTTTILTDQST